MIYVRWYVVCLKKYFEKHFYNRLEYGRLENSPHKYIFDILHSNLGCVCCFFPCRFVHFVSTHSVLPSRMLLGWIMPAPKTNVILPIILDLFLGWCRQPIFVGGLSSFCLCKTGWTSSWINISRHLCGYFPFLQTLDFSQKTSTLNLLHITQVIEKIPPLGRLLWNCIIWQWLVAFIKTSHMLVVLENKIWFHIITRIPFNKLSKIGMKWWKDKNVPLVLPINSQNIIISNIGRISGI